MPARHDVRAEDVVPRRLAGALAAAAEAGPRDFAQLLEVPGVGARTVRALALVAEVLHGAPCRFSDPARHAFAHGGKDRHPFPVPTRVYDQTIAVLKSAVAKAKLGRDEELAALKRLDAQARLLERSAKGPSVEALIAEERQRLPRLRRAQRVRLGAGGGGKTVRLDRSRGELARCIWVYADLILRRPRVSEGLEG